MRLLNSLHVVYRRTTFQMLQIATDLTVLQNRYTPLLYLIWVNITFFGYGKSVSPYPRCCHGVIFMRPSIVVRLHPITYRMATVNSQ